MGMAMLIDCNYDKTKIKERKFILKHVYKIITYENNPLYGILIMNIISRLSRTKITKNLT